ncbi:MAG: flagellar FliJ family protein [Phycisphaeraceae bacterium]|nr:flagellar FliJ family protein [Phycisphaerales bacterium]MCB9842933.1 flagellar FliJ family protein [Phycisphaeraceae bacterium]
MAKFRFPLQALLEHRSRIERDHRVLVAQAERARVDAENEVRSRQQSIVSIKDDLREALSPEAGSINLREARLQANASLHATLRTQQSALQLAGAMRRVDGARAALVEAAKERRALELLRDRRFEAWKQRMNKAETNELDDIANARAARGDEDEGAN